MFYFTLVLLLVGWVRCGLFQSVCLYKLSKSFIVFMLVNYV
jgi:hypothetical protein